MERGNDGGRMVLEGGAGGERREEEERLRLRLSFFLDFFHR